jgi:hypothetical protein
MMHMLAFSSNLAAGTAYLQVSAVADQVFSRSSNSFQMPIDHWLIAAFAGSADFNRARINTPSLRLQGFPQIIPANATELPGTDPNVMDLRENPLRLIREEDFRIDAIQDNAGAQNVTPVVLISDQVPNYNINRNNLRWIRFTSSVTAVARGWSNLGTITLEDTLAGETYGVYGMQIEGANVIAARLQFQGQDYRPGCLGQATARLRNHEMFRGGLGKFGQFTTYSLPQLETLENTAGASTPGGYLLIGKAA